MNIVLALLGSLLICGLLFVAQRWILMRSHVAFSLSVAEGEFEEAAYYYNFLINWYPKQFGNNPTLVIAAVDINLLSSSLPRERLMDFFGQLAQEGMQKAPKSPYPYLLAAGLASQRDPGCETCRTYLTQAIAAANRDISIYRQAGEIQMAAGMYRESERYFSLLRNIAIIHSNGKNILTANIALSRLYAQIEAAPSTADSKLIKYTDATITASEDDDEKLKASILKANEYARFAKFAKAAEVLYEAYSDMPLANKQTAMEILVHPLATALLRNGDPDSAEKVVETAAAMGIGGLDVERALIADRRGQNEQAQTLLKKALADSDGTTLQELRIALAYKELGNLTMATALLEQSARKKITVSNNPLEFFYSSTANELTVNDAVFFPFEPCIFGLRSVNSELAECYCSLQRYDEAAAEWRKLVRRYPHNPVFKVRLGNALLKGSHREEAAKIYRQAEKRLLNLLSEAPNCPVFHCALGDIYYHDGDEVSAEFHYIMASCEPYQKHAAEMLKQLHVKDADVQDFINKKVLEQTENSDARSKIAMALAVHNRSNTVERELKPSLEAKVQTP